MIEHILNYSKNPTSSKNKCVLNYNMIQGRVLFITYNFIVQDRTRSIFLAEYQIRKNELEDFAITFMAKRQIAQLYYIIEFEVMRWNISMIDILYK